MEISSILGLRASVGERRIVIQMMGNRSAFRQKGLAPDRAAASWISPGGPHIHRPPFTVQELGSHGWGSASERNPGSKLATRWALVGTLAATEQATSHVDVAGPTGEAGEPLRLGCRVPRVQGGGERGFAWVILLSMTLSLWKED